MIDHYKIKTFIFSLKKNVNVLSKFFVMIDHYKIQTFICSLKKMLEGDVCRARLRVTVRATLCQYHILVSAVREYCSNSVLFGRQNNIDV